MRRSVTSFALVLCGMMFIFGGIVSLTNAPVASAMPGLAPSTRPPVDRPTDEPETENPSGGNNQESDSSSNHAPATGHVTGTIIDAATGAPMPGITVNVGGVIVTSDANGNYDHWMTVGTYTVGLVLVSQQGADLQGPQTVEIRAGATTVQHLYFRSQAAPLAATPTVAVIQAVAPVGSLPSTGGPHAGATALQPRHLPRTSIPADSSWMWFTLGASLVLVGTLVGWSGRLSARRPVAHRAVAAPRVDDGDALLAALLAAHNQRPSHSADALLAALLGDETTP
jgi:hypothetical protein